AVELRDVRFPAPLFLDDARAPVHVVVSGGQVRVHSRGPGGAGWACHAQARLAAPAEAAAPEDLAAVTAGPGPEVAGEELFARAEAGGAVAFGPAFRRILGFRFGSGQATARLEADPRPWEDAPLHPALLDGALQVLGAAVDGHAAADGDAWV